MVRKVYSWVVKLEAFFFLSRNLYPRGRLCCCYSHYLPLPEFKLGLYVMESLCVSSKWPVAATSTTRVQWLTGRRNCEDNCVLLPGSWECGDFAGNWEIARQCCKFGYRNVVLKVIQSVVRTCHTSPAPRIFYLPKSWIDSWETKPHADKTNAVYVILSRFKKRKRERA